MTQSTPNPHFAELTPDQVTLRRAQNGDIAAFEELYRQFKAPVYTLAYRICQCSDSAQDVLQDAFVAAHTKLHQYRGEAPFWGWLRRIVVNRAISWLRQQKKLDHVGLELENLAAKSDGFKVRLDLQTALKLLSAQDRAVIWLHDVEGYNHREIGHSFGKTESFSKTRLSRARRRLRELLNQDFMKTEPDVTSEIHCYATTRSV